jgi:hypothetical protein
MLDAAKAAPQRRSPEMDTTLRDTTNRSFKSVKDGREAFAKTRMKNTSDQTSFVRKQRKKPTASHGFGSSTSRFAGPGTIYTKATSRAPSNSTFSGASYSSFRKTSGWRGRATFATGTARFTGHDSHYAREMA